MEQSPTPTMDREKMRMKFGTFRGFTVGAGLALPAFAVPADPKICLRTVGGPAMQALKLDGYHLMYPGDSSAPGYLVYNCRCTTVAVVDGVDTGGIQCAG